MTIYNFFRPLIFQLDAENAHNLAIKFLKYFPHLSSVAAINQEYESLKNKIWNINFNNPIGMAAGFDKNAETISALQKFGFGFIEVGTTTPKPQFGNDKPRIFRLEKDQAIINRLGFNNFGADVFLQNIQNHLPKTSLPIGINIGKNKDSQGFNDYLFLFEKFHQLASYITINISSPNTKNLRDLQKSEHLDKFLQELINKKNALKSKAIILLKIAPDLEIEEQEQIAKIVLANQIDGVIVSNTTIDRNLNLLDKQQSETGGLSGKPLLSKSNEVLKNIYNFTNRQIPLIGVGGISSAEDVYQKIKFGASLVQIYSAFIYQGFGMVEKIKAELDLMLKKDGFKNIKDAIGVEA